MYCTFMPSLVKGEVHCTAEMVLLYYLSSFLFKIAHTMASLYNFVEPQKQSYYTLEIQHLEVEYSTSAKESFIPSLTCFFCTYNSQ